MTEYQEQLREVKKWSQEKIPRITVGSLVLVLSEFKSRDLHWPVAQVLELRFDEEGVPQTAVIRLRKQITTRSVRVLAPVPGHCPEQQASAVCISWV